MQLQFKITFKSGQRVVSTIEGYQLKTEDAGKMTLADVTENVIKTEQFLERLTGYRVHIEQVA